MNERDTKLSDMLFKHFITSGITTLGAFLASLEEMNDSFFLDLPAFLYSTLVSDFQSKTTRLSSLAFLAKLAAAGRGLPFDLFLVILGRASALEKYFMYDIVVRKNLPSVV